MARATVPFWRQGALLLSTGLCVGPAQAQTAQSLSGVLFSRVPLWWCAAVVMVLLLCLVALWHNRRRHVAAERELLAARRELGKRVMERTDKLRAINARLYNEISRHQSTEHLLRETEQYLHSIINSMPSIMVGVNAQGVVTHWNSSAERATDISAAQALGHSVQDVFPDLPVDKATIDAVIRDGEASNLEKKRQGEGAHARYSDITVFPLKTHETTGAVIQIDDVTLRVNLENMMIQNEKMVALGELAAGMAHEINNPLSVIMQSAQNIQRRLSTELGANREVAAALQVELDTIRGYLEQRDILRFIDSIREAGERAANIVKNMLEFSRYGNRQYSHVDIIALVEHSLQLAAPALTLPRSKHERIAVERDYPTEELPPVPCYAAELQQVLLNLIRNATQAIAAEPGDRPQPPVITLRLRREERELVLEVEDNGPGMPESVRRHIFEPFYTTKQVGTGTGLGLSVSYFIITEHHGGNIAVSSRRGQGSCFTIRLPLEAPARTLAV